ncbi:SMC family ATPase [Oscillochloris sp. ZM17-4]|uniref:AAA family ATPase n=1 Tax=Oscillochloris sp. ZM17-4 TaxID=2866714 RepID=UPI001C73528F|nr:SMC family ATPase [Oscillochloris sp. ZM17-4]MBX0326921.1 SMC family ATPase [Oscillochloris sp. ZM17-4]
MIPQTLTIQNFMCYRADDGGAPLGLNLDGLHVVCLSGENGAGKSALLDAITWALWGEARTPDDDLIAQGESEMLVELVFQLGDQQYRVARRRQRGKTGKRGGISSGKTFLDLQVQDAAGWKPIAEATVRETQARIDDLLRMSYQTFINASFLLQGRADEFTSRTPAERKQVLADILDLGEYASLEAKARERARDLDGQLKGLRGRMEQLEESAVKLPFWAQSAQDAEEQVERMGAQAEQAEQAQAQADERLRALQAQAERRKTLLRELDALRKAQAAREQEIATLRGRIAADDLLISRREQIAQGVADLAAARAELDRLEELRGQHQELDERRRELQLQLKDALGELRAELARLTSRRDGLAERAAKIAPLQKQIAAAERQIADLAPLGDEREQLDRQRAEIEQRLDHLSALRLRQGELAAQIAKREHALTSAREESQRAMRRLDTQLADVPRWQQDLDAARAAAEQLTQGEAQLATLRTREQADVEEVSQQRAECKRLKAAADKLKANQKILADAGGECPVCRSELGVEGVAHVQAHYEQDLAELRAAYSEANRAADAGDAGLKQTRAAIAELEPQLARLRQTAAHGTSLEARITQADAWRAERAEAQKAHDSAEQQIAAKDFEPAAQAELAGIDSELGALGDQAELSKSRAALDKRLRELDKQLQGRGRAEGTLASLQQELAAVQAEAEALPAAEAELAALQRRIDEGDFAHDVRNRGRQVTCRIGQIGYSPEDHAAARELARGLERWTEEEHKLQLAEQRREADQKLLEQADELRARDAIELERLTREDALLEQELRGLPQADADARARADELRRARGALQAAQNDLVEKQTHRRRAQADAEQLERERENERAMAHRHGLLAELGEAFGKKGVQAMLIERAIPEIEDEANRLLGRMTDNQMHLSFEMQREAKSTGNVIETLEIKIADSLGTRVYDAFSGGEAMRANFAVRIALSRLLARRAGARLETLVIDEGFGALDALGRERMVEAITGVQDDFRRIIVITHIDELKDKFPAQIEVTKTPAGSRWELR